MSYPDSPVAGHRRTSHYDGYSSRSRDFSEEYDKSSKNYSGRRDRPRESNGHDSFGGRSTNPPSSRFSDGKPRDSGSLSGAKPSRVLGVFGLSLRTEERHLYDVMSTYGPLEDIQIVYDSLTGRSRGFAFVYFQNIEDAHSARAACARGLELHDRVLRVDYSLTSGPHQPTPGVYMGKDKRRNFPSRSGRYGYGDRRYQKSFSSYRRSRSRTRSPPRRRAHESPYHRRSRVVSSSRSRSPPLVYSPGTRRRPSASPSPPRRIERDAGSRFPGPPKDGRGWSERSGSSR